MCVYDVCVWVCVYVCVCMKYVGVDVHSEGAKNRVLSDPPAATIPTSQ